MTRWTRNLRPRTGSARLLIFTVAAAALLAACSSETPDAGSQQATTTPAGTTAPASGTVPPATTAPVTADVSVTTAQIATTGSTATTAPPATATGREQPQGPSAEQVQLIAEVLAVVFPDAPFEIEVQDTGLAYFGFNEGGDRNDGSSGLLSLSGDHATSEGVAIATPLPVSTVTSPFEIAGSGRGFEATLDVVAVRPDGVVVSRTFATGGPFEDLEPFSATISTGGYSGPLIVVVSSSTGLETDLPDFALVVIEVVAGIDGETASVVRVEADDVLNVRDAPNASATIVDELAPDETAVSVILRPDGLSGWWRIRTPAGVEGWSNSAFLILDKL